MSSSRCSQPAKAGKKYSMTPNRCCKPAKAEQEDIKGITNLLGNVNGDANGLINFGHASSRGEGSSQKTDGVGSYDEQTKAAKELAAAVAMLDGDNRAPSNGKKVRGLTNLTKDVVGNGNGAINFGSFAWRDDSKEKGRKGDN